MNYKNKNNPINIGFPLSQENRKKYQEGEDYKIEDREGGFKEYIILSEKLRADFRRFNGGKIFGNVVTEKEFKMPNENPEEWQKKMREENKKKRQKFIAENNPPNFQKTYVPLFSNDPKDLHNWWAKQPAFTNAELSALNDPVLEYLEDWGRALWLIQKVRQANSDIFPDEDFAWGEHMDKSLNDPQSSDYKAIQVLKKAGISLDKLFERVEKGRQTKEEGQIKKQQKYKEKILANLDDWTLFSNGIYNAKNHVAIELRGKSIVRVGSYVEENGLVDTETLPTLEIYQEVRQAIFNNLLKNIQENKLSKENYKKEDFSPQEWDKIEKEVNKLSAAFKSHNHPQINPLNHNGLITIIVIIGLTILISSLLVIKRHQKKHGPKR